MNPKFIEWRELCYEDDTIEWSSQITELVDALEATEKKLERAKKALKHGYAAMTFAYDDRVDQYYLNVQEQISDCLAELEDKK